jgi:hypothetical protein
MSNLANQYDEDIQAIDDAEPHERRLLGLAQQLSIELNETQVSSHSQSVRRTLKALTAQLIELGGGELRNVRPLKLRSLREIDAEIAREQKNRDETLGSGNLGAQAVVDQVIDPKIEALRAERELAARYAESSVVES